MTDQKITEIESTIAHQERQIEDLSEMLNLCRKEIDSLKRRLDITTTKLSDLELTLAEPSKEGLSVAEQAALDKPPHY